MTAPDLVQRIADVRGRITRAAERSGRDPASIRLIAVTKGVGVSAIAAAAAAGVRDFGENRVQEAVAKMACAEPESAARGNRPREGGGARPWVWHLIGRLQTNKARVAVGRFEVIHSVDTLRLGEAIEAVASAAGTRQRVLVQVNVGREAQKGGVDPSELQPLIEGLARHAHVQVEGLMTIPPPSADSEGARPYFRELRRLGQMVEADVPGVKMVEYSMGMSDDFEVAVAEGATMVRVGRAIFGARNGVRNVPLA
ncbi:MAG: YggS family pyridoxal phosphate-dependent enzyme [Nitrospirae bacterium]|nr:YggS family pyridoxal phosphate-dependent enzyme [Nitrospirota bacterium]